MNNFVHFIYVPFTGLGRFEGYRGDEWFKNRIRIFRDYTLKSLLGQTQKDFILWCSFRPQEKENPLIKELENILKESGLQYVLTFDGIMMWDDRGVEHNDDLIPRMEKSIGVIKSLVEGKEWVYITNFSSDDLLSRCAVEEIQNKKPKNKKALFFLKGYIYNTQTGQLADWNRDTSSAQYTIIYPIEVILDAKKWFDYEMNCLKSHEDIPTCFVAEQLKNNMYCCTTNGWNISTVWQNVFRGQEIYYEDDKKAILQNFGI